MSIWTGAAAATGLAPLGTGLGVTVTGHAGGASAPVAYQAAGRAAVRPATFYISRSPAGGSGWWMTRLRWSRWTRSSAAGRGREYASTSYASLTLSRVETRHGQRYYSRLAVAAPRGFTSAHLRWSWSRHEWMKTAPARSSAPVVYSGMGGRWSSAAVRPRYMAMGAHYYYDRLRWPSWTRSGAHGSGRINYASGAAGPQHRYPVQVALSDVKVHNGRRYFARMKVTSRVHMAGMPGHGPTTLHLWMSHGQWTWRT